MAHFHFFFLITLFFLSSELWATRLIEVLPVDNQCLVIHWQDGRVEYNHDDTTSGSCNGWDYYHTEKWSLCPDKDQYIPFGKPLALSLVSQPARYVLENGDGERSQPQAVYRKTKVWEASHDEKMPALHHWVYLVLPKPMETGQKYQLFLDLDLQSDESQISWVFEESQLRSPAIKISNLGYEVHAPHKMADIYHWMGDGGERDFSKHTGARWYLMDMNTRQAVFEGKLSFRMANKPEPTWDKDFTGADIWACDFSSFNTPGAYKLVIEGIGSSAAFTIRQNQLEAAFKTAMQGMFYQRMGCEDPPAGHYPLSRRPLYHNEKDPEGFTVLISKHDMVTGINPDKRDYYQEQLSGDTAYTTWGGWADAYDNDQRPVNFICVFDLLLTYYLQPHAFSDGQLYIPESDNDIPDLIDEALWEIDWWLRMRDPQGGYLTGLTNIVPPMNINYAGAACAWQGWCVAAGCAMVADCFRLAGLPELQQAYTDSALAAFDWANEQSESMLETEVSGLRGKDLKLTAAAFLYNLTGNRKFEDIIPELSEVASGASRIKQLDAYEQQYATLAYLLTPQEVNYLKLHAQMKAATLQQAQTDYIGKMEDSPTLAARYTSGWEGMVQTSNDMSIVAIAHRLAPDQKERWEKAMYSEAEWTLGRNPLGLIQMTGPWPGSISQTFAPGRRDGFPGVTPGWTPYMCRDGWNNHDNIHFCEWYILRNYPEKEKWPWGEHFWNSRYCVPNSEATPQQNFRQKIVLYGYLYAINKM